MPCGERGCDAALDDDAEPDHHSGQAGGGDDENVGLGHRTGPSVADASIGRRDRRRAHCRSIARLKTPRRHWAQSIFPCPGRPGLDARQTRRAAARPAGLQPAAGQRSEVYRASQQQRQRQADRHPVDAGFGDRRHGRNIGRFWFRSPGRYFSRNLTIVNLRFPPPAPHPASKKAGARPALHLRDFIPFQYFATAGPPQPKR